LFGDWGELREEKGLDACDELFHMADYLTEFLFFPARHHQITMDSVTQAVLGAAVGEATLGRRT
jgi:hypothetical protein